MLFVLQLAFFYLHNFVNDIGPALCCWCTVLYGDLKTWYFQVVVVILYMAIHHFLLKQMLKELLTLYVKSGELH